jgi:outer membrane protein assembly factor BamD
MRIKSSVAALLLTGLAGCSSLSMPSLPWGSRAKSDPTAEALFEEGNRNFNEKRFVRAIDNYSKIITDHPFSPMITEVELKIADAFYRNQQYPEAINAFKEFQSMHPTNENIPFVTLRLGQAHFDQFTSTDRDQKNTEIAKGYFENVITTYPKSPQAAEAKEKLAKCLEYLAEHEFNVAQFYYQQEKYPAARDRFEEIVRKYKDTPTAVKSLFYLGESYRNEKNSLRATLAYEAVIQHYPNSKFAADARTQLAQVEKEKHDPLALLLMRDRRPSAGVVPEVQPDPSLAKLRDLKLIAKTEVVDEKPGDEKGMLRRFADKLNPFSSSDKKDEQKSESAIELLAKRNQAQKKEESSGLLASLWPFGSKDTKSAANSDAKATGLVNQIDESLKQKGIDSTARQTLKPPPAELPKTDDLAKAPPPPTDTAALLSSIDGNLKKSGKNAAELPPPPEAAEGFKDAAAIQERIAKATPNQAPQDVKSSGILSGIDQKLKSKGVEPGKFEQAPAAQEVKTSTAQKPQARNIEIEPKVTLEKGPLYLSPAEVPAQEKPAASGTTSKPEDNDGTTKQSPSRVLVKGPIQQQAAAPKPTEAKQPSSGQDDEPKGVFDQLRQDIESASKALNPFRW